MLASTFLNVAIQQEAIITPAFCIIVKQVFEFFDIVSVAV